MFSVAGQITKRLLDKLGPNSPAWHPPRGLHPVPKQRRSTSNDSAPTGRKAR